MKFLLDARLPPALARWPREAGYEARPVREVGLRDADDRTIWDYAKANGLVLLTKDEDIVRRAQRSQEGR